jgi:hypothetical protein
MRQPATGHVLSDLLKLFMTGWMSMSKVTQGTCGITRCRRWTFWSCHIISLSQCITVLALLFVLRRMFFVNISPNEPCWLLAV